MGLCRARGNRHRPLADQPQRDAGLRPLYGGAAQGLASPLRRPDVDETRPKCHRESPPGGEARFDRPITSRLGGEQDQRVIDALSAAAMAHSLAADEFGVPLVA